MRNFRLLGDSIVKGDAGRWVWPCSAGDAVEAKAHVPAWEGPENATKVWGNAFLLLCPRCCLSPPVGASVAGEPCFLEKTGP